MITTILFDLDGTLLPMDQEEFAKAYFHKLAKKLSSHGYDTKELVNAIWAGTDAMVKNDGSRTNEEAFWKRFCELYGEEVRADKPIFDEFYAREFQEVATSCGYNPEVKRIIDELKNKGYRIALATNPIFPAVATESRIKWAGLDSSSFELYTTYENASYCKPNPAYYADILQRLDCKAENCLMVGNNVAEDMVAKTMGMSVFLITDCLINNKGEDISVYPRGSFAELMEYLV